MHRISPDYIQSGTIVYDRSIESVINSGYIIPNYREYSNDIGYLSEIGAAKCFNNRVVVLAPNKSLENQFIPATKQEVFEYLHDTSRNN